MGAMKSNKLRTSAVFHHKIPDRVPNFEVVVENPTFSYVMGRQMASNTLGNIPPEEYVEFAEKVGQDVIGMNFYFDPFFYEDKSGNLKPLDFRIQSRDDLKRLVKPDIAWLNDRFELLDKYSETVKGTDMGLFVLLGAFFTSAYSSIFGFDTFMYLMYDDLPLIEEVLEIGADYYVAIAEKVVQKDLTFFYVGDDVAFKSTTLINPDILRRIWLPRLKRIFRPALERGIPILFHSDGNIKEIIPDLIGLGIDALNPIEPYGMDILEIKKEYGRDVALVGNLDVGGNLSRGAVEDVRREARALIDSAGKDGGLILASSHSITRNVIPENYIAMVETAQTYGIYNR